MRSEKTQQRKMWGALRCFEIGAVRVFEWKSGLPWWRVARCGESEDRLEKTLGKEEEGRRGEGVERVMVYPRARVGVEEGVWRASFFFVFFSLGFSSGSIRWPLNWRFVSTPHTT